MPGWTSHEDAYRDFYGCSDSSSDEESLPPSESSIGSPMSKFEDSTHVYLSPQFLSSPPPPILYRTQPPPMFPPSTSGMFARNDLGQPKNEPISPTKFKGPRASLYVPPHRRTPPNEGSLIGKGRGRFIRQVVGNIDSQEEVETSYRRYSEAGKGTHKVLSDTELMSHFVGKGRTQSRANVIHQEVTDDFEGIVENFDNLLTIKSRKENRIPLRN